VRLAPGPGAGPVRASGSGLAPLSDAELVRAALQSQKNAIAELITRHWATAVGLAARVLGSADLAQDAAQEASITAMLGLDRLRTPDRFGAWFCGITLNVARRWLRHLRAELPASSIDEACGDAGPAERMEAAEIGAAIRAAITELAPGQRDAVFLFYLQGLTHREVAAELAISVGAVKARLHQARAALRPRLAPLRTSPEEHAAAEPPAVQPRAPEPPAAEPPAAEPPAAEPPAAESPAAESPGVEPIAGAKPPATAGLIAAPGPTAASQLAGPKETAMTASAAIPAWTDVSVAEIRRSEGDEPARVHVMVLAERNGPRQLPIWVGPSEATALALSLEAQETPRPLTYQMAARLVEAAGSRVTEVKINRLAESIFYAVIAVDGPAGSQEFDARPSDAVNLAVATGAAIRVDPALFDLPKAADHPDWQDFPTAAADLAQEARQRFMEQHHEKNR
jgi:RNA polymerase sigma factor (sigma-70 family)